MYKTFIYIYINLSISCKVKHGFPNMDTQPIETNHLAAQIIVIMYLAFVYYSVKKPGHRFLRAVSLKFVPSEAQVF